MSAIASPYGIGATSAAATPVSAQHDEWARRGLTGFYHFVQVSLLLASIPNVTAFWAAYESHAMPGGGLSIGGLVTIGDLRNALVGIMIDACVYVTSIVALRRLRTPHGRWVLAPHIIVMVICGAISFIANWETVSLAATTTAYSHFTVNTAWGQLAFGLGNTLIVSCAPLIAILMVFLAPSIVAQPPALTVEQIAAMTEREEAEIERRAKLEAARNRAQVQVVQAQAEKRKAQVIGAAETARAGVNAAFTSAFTRGRATPNSGADTLTAIGALRASAHQGATRGDDDPDPDHDPDPNGSSDSFWRATLGDENGAEDEGNLSDPSATLPQLPAVRRTASATSSGAPDASPSASQIAKRGKATKVSKQRDRYARMGAEERVRSYREVTGPDLMALLDIGATTARRILERFPDSRETNRFGDHVRTASIDRLITWLRQGDPQYMVYATQLDRLVNRPRSAATPKARARAMVDWTDESLNSATPYEPSGPAVSGDIRPRLLTALTATPNHGALNPTADDGIETEVG